VETVYNIEVADDHSYTVNNCIVHNCTFWSIAKQGREVTPDGMGGKLFMQYVRALHESGCKYFLYENNYSIHKDIKAFISEQLGVEPIMINSALVSAQQRKRCYWTNIPNVTQPEDKGIVLKDILEGAVSWQDKAYCMTSSYNGAVLWNTLERGQRTMVAVPVKGVAQRGRYVENGTEQHIEVRDDDKANCLTTVQKDSMVCEPVCVNAQSGNYTKPEAKQPCMSDRIYSVEGKNPAIVTGFRNNIAVPGEDSTPSAPIRLGHIGKTTGQANRVYSVRGKSVCLQSQAGGCGGAKTELYKINLPDGDYTIRKLTPIEAERLQTLPDNYTEGISNSQRYKCIGNGWTVDVIAHILSFMEGQ
jgi:DNA (cytosine-5)-methyltransferase 3A